MLRRSVVNPLRSPAVRSSQVTQNSSRSGATWVFALLTGLAVCVVYIATLYPSVPGGDAGELIAAVATNGVPHPPGYPLYVLLTKPFLWLPVFSIAWRANFASAVMAAAAASTIGWSVAALTGRRWAGLAAAAVFAFSPTVWLYAVGAEVFSLNNLLIAVELALLVTVDRAARTAVPDSRQLDRLVYAGAFVFGLGLSDHPTSLLLNAIFLAAMIWRTRGNPAWRGFRRWIVMAGWVAAGGLPYVYLPLSAAHHPLIAWGQTDTTAGFLTHVLRREYGTFQSNRNLANAAMPALQQLGFYARDLVAQVTWLGIVFAAWGLARACIDRNTRFLAFTTASAWALYLGVMHSVSAVPLDQPLLHGVVARFWMAPDLLVCVWIGWGLAALPLATPTLTGIAIVIASGQIILHARADNHRDDVMVRDYGSAILQGVPANALVLTRGDLITNTTRYLHDVEHDRPDVRLVDQEMLTFRWMTTQVQQQMPDVIVPGTHYDITAPGAYSIRTLVDGNIASHPIVVCGGTKPGDVSLVGMYRLLPLGLCDQLVPATSPIDAQAWLASAEAARPRFHADMHIVPDPESWEHVAWTDYWEAFHRIGLTCLTLAIERHDDPTLLRTAANNFDRLIAQDPQPPAYAYKNLGIARARLASVDPSAAALAVSAWQTYLRIGPADDPERSAIEQAVRTLSGNK